MNIIKGDLLALALDGKTFDVIVHGCNCFNTMGAGVAGQIANHPILKKAAEVDQQTIRGDWNKLGNCSLAVVYYAGEKTLGMAKALLIVNAYTQFSFGHGRQIDYCAIRDCMRFIRSITDLSTKIGMPKIGCGLGGGDWDVIFNIIHNTLHDRDVTIVEYDNGTK